MRFLLTLFIWKSIKFEIGFWGFMKFTLLHKWSFRLSGNMKVPTYWSILKSIMWVLALNRFVSEILLEKTVHTPKFNWAKISVFSSKTARCNQFPNHHWFWQKFSFLSGQKKPLSLAQFPLTSWELEDRCNFRQNWGRLHERSYWLSKCKNT